LTPAPSSDGLELPSPEPSTLKKPPRVGSNKENGLPSPITPSDGGFADAYACKEEHDGLVSSPLRRVNISRFEYPKVRD